MDKTVCYLANRFKLDWLPVYSRWDGVGETWLNSEANDVDQR